MECVFHLDIICSFFFPVNKIILCFTTARLISINIVIVPRRVHRNIRSQRYNDYSTDDMASHRWKTTRRGDRGRVQGSRDSHHHTCNNARSADEEKSRHGLVPLIEYLPATSYLVTFKNAGTNNILPCSCFPARHSPSSLQIHYAIDKKIRIQNEDRWFWQDL